MLYRFTNGSWVSALSAKPLEIVIGLCIFATAAAGGALGSVGSTSLAILFLASLFYIHRWPQWWRELTHNEQLLLVALALYMVSGLISYFNVNDQHEFVKHMGRYIRFLLIVPVYLLLSRSNARLFKYLVAGAIAAGPVYLSLALMSVAERPDSPAAGHYHHITFGDAAMLNVVFLLAVLLTWKTRTAMRLLMAAAMVCVLYASLLSQARGAWLALPVCVAVLLYLAVKNNRMKIQVVLPVLLLGMLLLAVSPVRNILELRVQAAVEEIELFVSGEKFDTSVGGRLAMWDIAIDVWRAHPIIGTGLGDFDREIESRQSQGRYETIEVMASAHNIYLQALATTGVVGFAALCFALLIQPLRVFFTAPGQPLMPVKLGGMMAVLAYAVFGLTESWILRAPVVSIFLVYLVTLSASASRAGIAENDLQSPR